MTIPEVQKAVHHVYTTNLSLPPDWTEHQRLQFLTEEAQTISEMVLLNAATQSRHDIETWRREHPDQHLNPTIEEHLSQVAYNSAMRNVLNTELFDLIAPTDPDNEPTGDQPELKRNQVSWDQRWTRPQYRCEPSPQIEDLIERLWPEPTYSTVFRIKAGYLLAARAEEMLPNPDHQDDPLAGELATMVYSDLRQDGLPER